MLRLLVALILLCATLAQAQDPRPLAQAMAAMRVGNWAEARISARGDGDAAVDVIEWHRLRAGLGTAGEVMDFLRRNPDWPGLPYLREKSEIAMGAAPVNDRLEFFDGHTPETGAGALALAEAYAAQGEDGLAESTLVLAWRTLALSQDEHDALVARWGDLLAPHHEARMDMTLWNGWSQNAEMMRPLVSDGWNALADARLTLRALGEGVDTLIRDVPNALSSDPGLAFERFVWRARKGRDDSAIDLLLDRSESAERLGNPQAWASRRQGFARGEMRAGNADRAYRIASRHGLSEGSDYAALEWLSGFIALRLRDDAGTARTHFQNFTTAVASPISLGRAGYWLGRAEERLGNARGAQEAYAFAAQYQTSFYGLLAAERGGLALDPTLAGREATPPWRDAPFTRSTVFSAAVLLLASGELDLSERFFTHLSESLDRTQILQMGAMLQQMNRPHIQVMLGKRAASMGIEVPGPYYALHPLATRDGPVPPELSLAIARRESEFDPGVISGAGARGLMQLMPGTAQEVSERLGLDYAATRLLTDPDYNATLGTAYLEELIGQFDGNPVMVAAAYNAGPSRPERWMQEMGDPRRGRVDMIDWIEMIPFAETRNYVMRVTESLPVYRARLGREPLPVPFSEELTGRGLLR